MTWKIEFDKNAVRELEKLDRPISKRILQFLNERLSKLSDPHSIGEALKGSRLNEFWKYRVGDYRIIANIEDSSLTILVVRIGNRREVYRAT